ncbi:PIN domain-containing protein [uncultured Pseudomonas sp.]|uniref:PIN domain-containing protein n=1 Tax=uncultured Pseudomonas sp. TaxID=114707 RepID=UPI0025E972FC|nr:PIN domain-containing protein [uncultured Pseudomonas sp.]
MPKLHVFIDTNIFLNFYSFSDDKPEVIDELSDIVASGGIVLHLPKQVENEFKRNRESKIQKAMDEFKNANLPTNIPQHMRGTDVANKYIEALNIVKTSRKLLIGTATSLALTNELDIDIKINRLFGTATNHPDDNEIYAKSLMRTYKGDPPGKPDGLGDRYIWETLLSAVPNVDLFIVSKDGDYTSKLSADQTPRPLPFLTDEWSEKKGQKQLSVFSKIKDVISYYNNLLLQPADPVDTPEVPAPPAPAAPAAPAVPPAPPAPALPPVLTVGRADIDAAVTQLAESPAFSYTHAAVAKLKNLLPQLTIEDASRLCQAALNNNQIGWIITDDDVYDFYLKLINNWAPAMDADLAESVFELLGLTEQT